METKLTLGTYYNNDQISSINFVKEDNSYSEEKIKITVLKKYETIAEFEVYKEELKEVLRVLDVLK